MELWEKLFQRPLEDLHITSTLIKIIGHMMGTEMIQVNLREPLKPLYSSFKGADQICHFKTIEHLSVSKNPPSESTFFLQTWSSLDLNITPYPSRQKNRRAHFL